MILIFRLIAFVVGLAGIILLIPVFPLGCGLLIFGSALIIVAARMSKSQLEERRHQELVNAQKQKS